MIVLGVLQNTWARNPASVQAALVDSLASIRRRLDAWTTRTVVKV